MNIAPVPAFGPDAGSFAEPAAPPAEGFDAMLEGAKVERQAKEPFRPNANNDNSEAPADESDAGTTRVADGGAPDPAPVADEPETTGLMVSPLIAAVMLISPEVVETPEPPPGMTVGAVAITTSTEPVAVAPIVAAAVAAVTPVVDDAETETDTDVEPGPPIVLEDAVVEIADTPTIDLAAPAPALAVEAPVEPTPETVELALRTLTELAETAPGAPALSDRPAEPVTTPAPTVDITVSTDDAPLPPVAPVSVTALAAAPTTADAAPSDVPAVAVTAAAPAPVATGAATVAAVDAPPPPPAPAAAPAAEQLVNVLRPLRSGPDGTYRMHLELRPPELGRVELRVEVRDGVVNAVLTADDDAARLVMRESLNDLRSRLEIEGVRAGRLSVDDGRTSSQFGQGQTATQDERDNRTAPAVVETDVVELADLLADNDDDNLDVRL